jgi:hypothetical protein
VIILGIDPGLNGGLALVAGPLNRQRLINAIDVPTVGEETKKRVDVHAVLAFIQATPPDEAYIERAGLMPDQNVAAGGIYMRAAGYLECCVVGLDIPIHIIESGSWKRVHGLYGIKGRDGLKMQTSQVKEASRQKALQLFPAAAAFMARKKDHGRAEAALIAAYGLKLRI